MKVVWHNTDMMLLQRYNLLVLFNPSPYAPFSYSYPNVEEPCSLHEQSHENEIL